VGKFFIDYFVDLYDIAEASHKPLHGKLKK